MIEESIAWEIRSDYVHSLAKAGQRQDGRKMDAYRKIEVIPNYIPNAYGSALCRIGATQVLVGVSLILGTPYPDSPDAGVLMTGCELVPLASPTFESGPPRENAIELARVVDRGIRESKSIDFSKLCIEPKEKVWLVMVDLHVLDYDGNLFDAAELAATSALWNTVMPKVENNEIVHSKTKQKLPITKKPVNCTFVKIADKLMIDPCLDEERAMDAGLSCATTEDSQLCALQKLGSGPLTMKEVEDCLELALTKGNEMRKLL